MSATSQLTAVFFDLDETLVHSRPSDAASSCPEPPAAVYGPWSVWLRPTARALLASARALRVPVLLCTTSEHRYALGISRTLELGFAANEILAFEHLCLGRRSLCPRGLLMDDLPAHHDAVVLKHQALGLTQERHFQAPAFQGTALEADTELIVQWKTFLRRLARKAA